ncbi:MAG: SDR family oxidoreductase [Planctomycetales bacterium]|nr:SDR family oxidoreductase [Planctomycetales bacterium]
MSIFDRFRLDGKRLFISGGSRGLGREMSLALADAGADVILVGRDADSLEQTAGEIRQLGRQAWPLQADLGDTQQCAAVCQTAVAELGPIDILINNVGGRRESLATEEFPLEKWRQLMDLNLTSVFLCTKIVGGAMIGRGQGGRIINIASINALVVGKRIQGRHYETAKAAIQQFTRATAVDWAPHRITVNAICPGGFMTEPNRRWSELNPEMVEGFRQEVPLGDYGQPEDLGPLAVYLASDAARYMTGASLVIDGGYTLC